MFCGEYMNKEEKNRQPRRVERWQIVAGLLMVFDVVAICLSYFLALWLRFDMQYSAIIHRYLEAYQRFILPCALVSVICFHFLGMYRSMWAFAGLNLLTKCLVVFGAAGLVHALVITVFFGTVIHTVRGFGIVKKAEIDVFLELSCFFNNPADVGNLISGSSAFSKTSLNIWKFMVHVLLKPGLENFEHYFTSV